MNTPTHGGRALAVDVLSSVVAVVLGFALMAVFLLLAERDPIQTFSGLINGGFGTRFGIHETLVAAAPIMLCALAVAVAAWVGLLSIGAEGQLYVGAAGAVAIALAFPNSSAWVLIPLMMAAGAVCGGVWSAVPGALRAKWGVNETIVTLLLNYVGILLVEYLVHGPMQDAEGYGWPQSPQLPKAAELARWPQSRLHLGVAVAPVLALFFWVALNRTRIGFVARVIGANPKAAETAHYPVARYLFVAMLVSGMVAGLAGMIQVSGVEGRLRASLSQGYGYTGFLVAWLARHNPLAIVVVSVLLGGLLTGANNLQLMTKLPFASVNILQGCLFFSLLESE